MHLYVLVFAYLINPKDFCSGIPPPPKLMTEHLYWIYMKVYSTVFNVVE